LPGYSAHGRRDGGGVVGPAYSIREWLNLRLDLAYWQHAVGRFRSRNEIVFVGFVGVGDVTFGIGPMELLLAALLPVGIGPTFWIIDVFNKFQVFKIHRLFFVRFSCLRWQFTITRR
jgi:hypothetical protein